MSNKHNKKRMTTSIARYSKILTIVLKKRKRKR